jgi:hypothetical protein
MIVLNVIAIALGKVLLLRYLGVVVMHAIGLYGGQGGYRD